MAKRKQSKKLRITTLLLALALVLSFCSFFLAACTSSTTEEDDSSPTRTDTQTFANANFEYFNDSDGDYLIAEPENWTAANVSNSSGTSSSSSVARSGIVDTSLDWSKFVDAYDTYQSYDESGDDPSDDENYFSDIDNYYDIPGWDVVKTQLQNDGSEDDITQDDAFSTHRDDIATAAAALNPRTHDYTEGSDSEDTHVLMLHNYRSDGYGTARQYTSSTITLSAGSAAKVSVWVKTSEMTFGDGRAVNGNRGAFIQITNTVGGTTRDPLVVRNIDTTGTTENNGWVQYTFYIKASAYTSTTFAVVLGLGRQTEVNAANSYEYVQGYAFFDDLTYEVMTADEYNTAAESVISSNKFALDLNTLDNASSKVVNAGTDTTYAFNLDELGIFGESGTGESYFEQLVLGGNVAETIDDYGKKYEDYVKQPSNFTEDSAIFGDGLATANEISSHWSGMPIAERFRKLIDGELPFADGTSDMIFLYSSDGAPQTYTTQTYTLAKDESRIISFWVKTSAMNGGTGATVTLVDEANNKTTIGAVDTTTLDTVDLTDDTKTTEDIFDGWQQCFLFVTNDTDEDLTYTLQFSFGPLPDPETKTLSKTASDYIPGWAAFAGIQSSTAELTDAQFSAKTTGTYAVDVSLTSDTNAAESSFDDVAYTDDKTIETDIADLRNYDGVYGNSSYVGGSDITTGKNELPTAGLINKDYADNYESKLDTWFPTLADSLNRDNWWNTLIGDDCTQPLFISNTLAEAIAYGYVASTPSNLAASSSNYTAVVVRVKLSKGSTANVYLIDTTAPNEDSTEKQYANALAYSAGISYRYDEDGNVVNRDPDDTDYNKDVNTVFYKQDNGLWYTSEQFSGDTYYANLQNFAEYDRENKTEDLLNSSGGVAYYAHDGEYYRYYDEDDDAYSVKVRDFSEAGVSDEKMAGAVLQQATGDKYLSREVSYNPTETDAPAMSDWIYVRFFIKTGDTAKDYRLEVWSGSRDGITKNAANSLVVFDTVTSYAQENIDKYASKDAAATYAEMVLGVGSIDHDDLLKALEEDYSSDPSKYMNAADGSSLVYYHYSLYDDIDYASYDPDRSSDSDPYSSYDASSYSNQLAFLRYKLTEGGREYYDTIVDYSASEISVSTSTDDDTTDDTTDDSTDGGQNIWLLITSIILAAALVFTMLALLIRKLLSNMKKKSVKTKPMYDNKRKRYIRKLRLEESEKDENADDVLPDEDEYSEEDIYSVDQTDESKEIEESTADEQTGQNDSDDGGNKDE